MGQLNLEYAKAYLKLAKVNLQKAEMFNERVPGAFSAAEVTRLKYLVALAEERLNWVQQVDHKQSDANTASASTALQTAKSTYEKSLDANRRLPGAVTDLQLEEYRLNVELARLNLEKSRLVGGSNSVLAGMQFELDQLREDVLQLRSRVEAITAAAVGLRASSACCLTATAAAGRRACRAMPVPPAVGCGRRCNAC